MASTVRGPPPSDASTGTPKPVARAARGALTQTAEKKVEEKVAKAPAPPPEPSFETMLIGRAPAIELEDDGGSLELDEHPAPNAVKAPRRTRYPVQVVDWEAERKQARELVTSDLGVWTVAKAVLFLLGVRLLASLVQATDGSKFTIYLRLLTAPLLFPFKRLVAPIELGPSNRLELSVVVALLFYFVVFAFLSKGVKALMAKPAKDSKATRRSR